MNLTTTNPVPPDCDPAARLVVLLNLRPWNTNASTNRWKRADVTREWRALAAEAAQAVPAFEWFRVTVQPYQKGGRLADVAGCAPSVKAAIDGLIDAGLAPDDSPTYLKSLMFLPPENGHDALALIVDGVLTNGANPPAGRLAVA